MTDATLAQPGTDPDRASFTTALEAARDQLTAAAGVSPAAPARPGPIGQAVLAALLPAPAAALQRPPRQMLDLPLPRKRRHPPPAPRSDHRDRHHAAHPAPGSRRTQPRPVRLRDTAAPAADPARADHRHHHQPAPARLERPRTRPAPARQAPQHAHPARRMGQAGLLHPNRLRHLRPQHAKPSNLDKRSRPLTTRHCLRRRPAAGLDPGASAAPGRQEAKGQARRPAPGQRTAPAHAGPPDIVTTERVHSPAALRRPLEPKRRFCP
jgi:hypothetical protein